MTDKQFEKIKKGLQFHSEGGIDNLCTMTETTLRAILDDATKELEAQIEKMKSCKICKHYQGESCNYHSNWVKDCKENGMKLFELKEIKEK